MLVPLPTLLARARDHGYGVGYFEAWDSYSLEAVVAAAEAERAPVILGFGCMMVDQAWLDNGGIAALGYLGQMAAARTRVPAALLLNEAQTYEQALAGIASGFNAVMLDTSRWPREQALARVAALVEVAHGRGVAVEAELGRLPDAIGDRIDDSAATLTDPDQAAAFVAQTGVDCLAIAFGNVHLLLGRSAPVDMARLAAINERVPVPLVIHGGTSFPAEAVPDAIAHGAIKFNVGTILKQTFLDGVRATMAGWPTDVSVHDVLGSHRAGDLMGAAQERMRSKVRGLMRLYGSSGQVGDPEPASHT